MRIEDIDRYSDQQLNSLSIPASVQDKRGFLKFAAERTGSLDKLDDPVLIDEFSRRPPAGTVRADLPGGASAAIRVNPDNPSQVQQVSAAAPEGVPLPKLPTLPASRAQARRVDLASIEGSAIQRGSTAPATPNIVNPLDQLGVNPTALQMRAISLSGSSTISENPYAADPALVGEAARKINAGIKNPAAYAAMSPAEHRAIEPFLDDTLGGKSFKARRDSKLASETARIEQQLNDPSKPVKTIEQFSAILQTADPLVRSLVLMKASELLPANLKSKLDQEAQVGIQRDTLLKLNAPYFLAAANDPRMGVTENQVRSFLEKPDTPEAERFFAAYLADEERPRYVGGETIRYVEGQKPTTQRFRSPHLRYNAEIKADADVLISGGADKADVAVAGYRDKFKTADQIEVPAGLLQGGDVQTRRIAATAIDSTVVSARRRIADGMSPDDAVDRAMAAAIKDGDIAVGSADGYKAVRAEVVSELRRRAEIATQAANDRVNAEDRELIGGFIQSIATPDDSRPGSYKVNEATFPDLSGPDRQVQAALFMREFSEQGFDSAEDYIVARTGATGKAEQYIRDVAALDPVARAANHPEIDEAIKRVSNNYAAGKAYFDAFELQQRRQDAEAEAERVRKRDAAFQNFKASYPEARLTPEEFEAQTIDLGNGRYKQFVTPALKAIYDSGDEDIKKFIDTLQISDSGAIGAVDPLLLQTFTAAARGGYAELVTKKIPVIVAKSDGTREIVDSPIPMLTDDSVSLMNQSVEKAATKYREAVASAGTAKGGTAAINQVPQNKVDAPEELKDVMTDSSGWYELYAQGIKHGVETGDYSKANTAYLAARARKIKVFSERVRSNAVDVGRAIQVLAGSIGAGVDDPSKFEPEEAAALIEARVDSILEDGRIDPSEYTELPSRAFDQAIGSMTAARKALKADLETLKKIGSDGIWFEHDKDGNVVSIQKAELADFDRIIRKYEEMAVRVGSVIGEFGEVLEAGGIPEDIQAEVERQFNNPAAFQPRWRRIAEREARMAAIRSIAADGKVSPIGVFDPLSAAYTAMERVGISGAQADALIRERAVALLPQAEADIKVRIANRIIKRSGKAEKARARVVADEAEREAIRKKLLNES